MKPTADGKTSMLECLSEDLSALIISHLNLQEIALLSTVSKRIHRACRSDTLWKYLLTYRWNVSALVGDENYYESYQRAHAHPHDLWVTHWNIVYPTDGIAPGRCLLTREGEPTSSTKVPPSVCEPSWRACPKCRDWDCLARDVENDIMPNPTTPAEIMALATIFAIGNSMPLSPPPSPRQSRDAFACAGTFYRKLCLKQYEAAPTGFLTDLLFFNITDPSTEEGRWELEQILREVQHLQDHESDDGQHDRITPLHETSNHSWHICRLTNPDFYRPIVYQVGLQRPDCFTVYPAEGYIEPGSSTFLTVGVRPLGSALAYAFDALNIQRDGLEAAWADIYTDQAHLPMAPILIRYQYVATNPTAADTIHDPRRRPSPVVEQEASNNLSKVTHPLLDKEATFDYHWRQPIPAHRIRTIHLSAHVHSNYSLTDFLNATCQPWDTLSRDRVGPIVTAPNLMEFFPEIYKPLENRPVEDGSDECSVADIYRANKPCVVCSKSWGLREEEIAQAYLIVRAENAIDRRKKRVTLENIRAVLQLIQSEEGLTGDATQLSALLLTANHILQSHKCSPCSTFYERRNLVELEAIIDNVYRQIPVGGENWIPWRLAGVYRFALCTDSVFRGPLLHNMIDADFKDEPYYLDAFRHLAHSPGYYCLGPQEDPNHLQETVVDSSPRYTRFQKGFVTDMFMDDPISAFQAGICMMRDPRSLMVHGIYDRVPYPGFVVRRPKLWMLDSLSTPSSRYLKKYLWSMRLHTRIPDRWSITLRSRLNYYLLQNGLDVEAIRQIEERMLQAYWTQSDQPEYLHLSFNNYVRGIPAPGIGRFALSQEVSQSSESSTKRSIVGMHWIEPKAVNSQPIESELLAHQQPRSRIVENAIPRRVVAAPNLRGPRLVQLLWILGAQLGLAVIDNPDVTSVFVDRNILIASQWVSISLMAAPLFWTLCARYVRIIPSQPVDYNLEDLPFHVTNKMRFLTDRECGFVAVMLLLVWLALGRWSERHISRDFFRVMLEHISPYAPRGERMTRIKQFSVGISLWLQRQWDVLCPLFLQRRVFAPHWNRRSTVDLMKHLASWRSRNIVQQRSAARPLERRVELIFGDSRDEGCVVTTDCPTTKLIAGLLVALGSFCSSSPHFWLNLVTVFSCSISLGMSVSLHSMEKGGSGIDASNTGSMLKSANLATVVISAFLVGQLVGSSGGTMFLAEFIVTSISLILGGAGVSVILLNRSFLFESRSASYPAVV